MEPFAAILVLGIIGLGDHRHPRRDPTDHAIVSMPDQRQ